MIRTLLTGLVLALVVFASFRFTAADSPRPDRPAVGQSPTGTATPPAVEPLPSPVAAPPTVPTKVPIEAAAETPARATALSAGGAEPARPAVPRPAQAISVGDIPLARLLETADISRLGEEGFWDVTRAGEAERAAALAQRLPAETEEVIASFNAAVAAHWRQRSRDIGGERAAAERKTSPIRPLAR